MIESAEPDEIDRMLREWHIPNIAEERQRNLAARVCGCPAEEIAARLNFGIGSACREIKQVQIAIFDLLGLKHDAWATGEWSSHHTMWCVAFAARLIETSRIFPREKGLLD